jgi:hypothetical protein
MVFSLQKLFVRKKTILGTVNMSNVWFGLLGRTLVSPNGVAKPSASIYSAK